ncbi:hypothetical protein ACU4GD_35325 [Cupriavidus basilensis]
MAVGAFALLITASPWRRERIFAYLNPWEEANAPRQGLPAHPLARCCLRPR